MGKWLDRARIAMAKRGNVVAFTRVKATPEMERWRYINSPEFEDIQSTYLRVLGDHSAFQLRCSIYGLGTIPEWEVDPKTYAKCVKYASHYGWVQPKVSGVPVVARK